MRQFKAQLNDAGSRSLIASRINGTTWSIPGQNFVHKEKKAAPKGTADGIHLGIAD